jgi:hypothetical protein
MKREGLLMLVPNASEVFSVVTTQHPEHGTLLLSDHVKRLFACSPGEFEHVRKVHRELHYLGTKWIPAKQILHSLLCPLLPEDHLTKGVAIPDDSYFDDLQNKRDSER